MLRAFKQPGQRSYFLRLPIAVHQELARRAKAEHRSLAMEVVHLLDWALKHKKAE